VARSLEAVVVDDSAIDLRSRRDPWVATRGARSLLAVPLLRQGALTVLVFLEHGAATHAFHAERLEALRVLGSQLVISFENARLHGELVRTNERLSAALERAAESARAKNEALTTTSHDLRAPLHALVALPAQLLREAEAGPLDECRLLDGLRTVAREGQRLSHIVDDVLDAALLEGEGLHLSRAPVDVAALLAALEAEAAPSARDAGVSLVVEPIDASKGALEVGADGERLRQVLRILVGNAVQRSGGKGTVRVRAWRVLDEVRFSVRDDGHARRPSLALSIAHKLVALHGGRIDVASDSATTCVVTLPL
jgi:signal transduction histidine kinase